MTVRELRLVLTVEDFDAALAFYRDALGLEERDAWEAEGGGHIDVVATTLERVASALDGADVVAVPDCGLNHLPRDVAFAKLRALAQGAALVRGRHVPAAVAG